MAKEKNIVRIAIFTLIVPAFSLPAATVCTTYPEDVRICGGSLVFETGGSFLSQCSKHDSNCKKIVATNSHVTGGTTVEICDDQFKCSIVPQQKILNDVINDVAVFEIDESNVKISTNSSILGTTPGITIFESYRADGHDTFSGALLNVQAISPGQSALIPSWVDKKIETDGSNLPKNTSNGVGNFLVASGMSGSPLTDDHIVLNESSIGEIKGLVTGHHNYLPISFYTKKEAIENITNSLLSGQRGRDQRSTGLDAKWHYSLYGKTTFRSLNGGEMWETGLSQSPTGGATGTDTGGATGTDTGGATGTDTGGATGTDTGGATGTDTGCSLFSQIYKPNSIEEFTKHFTLYHGVIIDNKKVIGFYDKQNGRFIQATWEILAEENISKRRYVDFEPYYDSNFNAKTVLRKNHPHLFKRKAQRYCLNSNDSCITITINNKNELVIGPNDQFSLPLDSTATSDVFKNIPLILSDGRTSSLWLADLFFPDVKMDVLRKSNLAILGGNHKSMRLEVFTHRK